MNNQVEMFMTVNDTNKNEFPTWCLFTLDNQVT